MAFFEDVILTDSIEVKTTPENIFNFLTSIVDDDSYSLHFARLEHSFPNYVESRF